MFFLKGQLVNLFESPKGVSKSGEEYGGNSKLQVLGDIPLKNGECRKEIVTLSTDEPEKFKSFVGRDISLPVGIFSSKGVTHYFIPKGASMPSESSK